MIRLGNSKIVGIKKGSTNFIKLYLGNHQLFSATEPTEEGSSIIYGCSKKLSDQVFIDATGLDVVSHSQVSGATNKYKVVFDGSVVSIGDDFLRRNLLGYSITTIQFNNFQDLESIGDYFLQGQSSISNLDLSEFVNVDSIGDYFLANIAGLESLDMSPMITLATVGDNFISTSHISTIELAPNMVSVGENFLKNCKQLTSLDLTPFSNTTTIGYLFLDGCDNLTTMIIDNPDKAVLLPLQESWAIPEIIYVNDEFIDQYKSAISDFSSLFAPLSEKQ